MRRGPREWRTGAFLLAGICAATGLSAPAGAEDPNFLQPYLAPRDAAGTPDGSAAAGPVEPRWMPPEAVERERSDTAREVGQDYVSDHLEDWLDDTPLAAVERLRRTDLVISGDGGGEARPEGGLDVRLRVAERVRLTVAREEFRRDLVYDPLRNRMSMDLFHTDLSGPDTGLALTDTYEVGDDAHRLLLNLRHRIQ